jgi:hypothetical protein
LQRSRYFDETEAALSPETGQFFVLGLAGAVKPKGALTAVGKEEHHFSYDAKLRVKVMKRCWKLAAKENIRAVIGGN